MRHEDIHVGDRLRIREWGDMEAEFGTTDSGSIDCKFVFTVGMRDLCGMEFTVARIDKFGEIFSAEQIETHGLEGFLHWKISADMLEPADNACQSADLPEPDGLFSFLYSES